MSMENLDEFGIPEEALKRLSDPDILRRYIDEGKSFQDILGYSNETMEKFYGAAHRLFTKEQYQEAADAFVFLTTLNPYVHNYWLGLGMCEQLNTDHEAALVAYGMAVITDDDNPLPHYHSACCLEAVGDLPNAIASLDLTIDTCGHNEKHQNLKEHALRLKTRLFER